MSKSIDTPGDEFRFSSEGDAETFVRTLMEHRRFCYWCLAPLEVNPIVQFPDEPEGWPLETAKTFDEYGCPVDDVPPDRTDDQGRLIEPSRDEKTICGNCGVLDTGPGYSRSKETKYTQDGREYHEYKPSVVQRAANTLSNNRRKWLKDMGLLKKDSTDVDFGGKSLAVILSEDD